MLVLVNPEVASANAAHPVGSSFAGDYRCEVFGVERSNADLCDELGVTFIRFNINADKDGGGFLFKSNELARMEEGGGR